MATKKTSTRKSAAKKPAAKKKTTARKAAAKKPATRKVAAKKPAAKKTTAKKTTTRKVAAKKPAAKKTVAKKAAAKKTPAKKVTKTKLDMPYTKTALYTSIAETTGLEKKQVLAVFEALGDVVESHIKKRGPQTFTLPGLLKIKVNKKPATKARKGTNPFTGEEMMFKAKPARNVVKVQALKKLKDFAA